MFLSDGSSVLTASVDKTAKIFDGSIGECKETLTGHDRSVISAVFSADGSSVLTASCDCIAKILDSYIGECKQILFGRRDRVGSAVFSADGSLVLTVSLIVLSRFLTALQASANIPCVDIVTRGSLRCSQ